MAATHRSVAEAALKVLKMRHGSWLDVSPSLRSLVDVDVPAMLNDLAEADERIEALTGEVARLRDGHAEVIGSALYDIVRHVQAGRLDDHDAVRAIDDRVVLPLVARERKAKRDTERASQQRRRADTDRARLRSEIETLTGERDQARGQLARHLTAWRNAYQRARIATAREGYWRGRADTHQAAVKQLECEVEKLRAEPPAPDRP